MAPSTCARELDVAWRKNGQVRAGLAVDKKTGQFGQTCTQVEKEWPVMGQTGQTWLDHEKEHAHCHVHNAVYRLRALNSRHQDGTGKQSV